MPVDDMDTFHVQFSQFACTLPGKRQCVHDHANDSGLLMTWAVDPAQKIRHYQLLNIKSVHDH
jgi:hypothetical protein